MDLAARTPALRGLGIQEWLSFYFKDPDTAPGVYPEHDLFIQSMKLKNTLRHIMGEDLITHLGLEYYGTATWRHSAEILSSSDPINRELSLLT
jgi:myo-inositol-1-phosphate synthase